MRGILYFVLGAAVAFGAVVAATPGGPVTVDVNVDLDGNATNTPSADSGGVAPDEGRDTPAPDTTPTVTETPQPDATASENLDVREIAFKVHARINEIRQERGLNRLRMSAKLREAALLHSEDMATQGYFAHEAPDGSDFTDRYAAVGYRCRVDLGPGNGYSAGAENIAYTWADSDIVADDGRTIDHNGNETRIAHGLVSQWMNSPPHRENILKEYWENEGIGIATASVDGGTKVYATQNFC